MSIRSAAKAIIFHKGKILVNRYRNPEYGTFYDLPGGGQEQYESLEDAVVREVLEETGYHVTVKRFVALAEEIYDSPVIREKYRNSSHRVLHIFLVEPTDDLPEIPSSPDHHQEASIWVPLEEVDALTFHPTHLSGQIRALVTGKAPMYLGTVRVQ